MKAFAKLAAALFVLLPAWIAPAQVADTKPPKKNPSIATVPGIVSEVDGRSFDEWKADLKHPDPSVRAEAIVAIVQFGSLARDAVPLLLDRCLDKDASPRVKAVIALTIVEIVDREKPRVIDALALRAGEDLHSIVRYQAAVALDHRFADHPHARNAVLSLLKGSADNSSWEIRRVCLSALRRCGRDDKTGPDTRVTQAMMRALQDPAAKVRLEGAIGLGGMGRPGDPILLAQMEKALLSVVRDRDKSVGLWAQVALMALADKVKDSQLEVLAKGLSSPDARLRAQTVRAIGVLGDRARPCMPALITALRDKEKIVVVEACGALVNVGEKSARVLDALTELTNKKEKDDEALREFAKTAIEQLTKPKNK